jgi:hypothetical protein
VELSNGLGNHIIFNSDFSSRKGLGDCVDI